MTEVNNADKLGGGRIPQPNRAIRGCGGQSVPVWGEGNRGNDALMLRKRKKFLAGCRLPEPERASRSSRGKDFPVSRERQRIGPVRARRKVSEFFSCQDIPQANGGALRIADVLPNIPGSQQLPVRRERQSLCTPRAP